MTKKLNKFRLPLNFIDTFRFSVFVLFGVSILSACGSGDKGKPLEAMKLANEPVFSTTSTESVLLRYKFKKGEAYKAKTDMTMQSDASQGSSKMAAAQNVHMEIEYSVKEIGSDQAMNLDMIIRHIQVKTSGLKEFQYDSKQNSKDKKPEYILYNALLDTPVKIKLSDQGKMLAMDYSEVEAKVKASGNSVVLANLKRSAENLLGQPFSPLPEKSVKAGDRVDAGSQTVSLPNVGRLKTKIQFEIAAVSADKSKVLLRPVAQYSIEKDKDSKVIMNIEKAEQKAWILFDVTRGVVQQSVAEVRLQTKAEVQGKKVESNSFTQMNFVNQ